MNRDQAVNTRPFFLLKALLQKGQNRLADGLVIDGTTDGFRGRGMKKNPIAGWNGSSCHVFPGQSHTAAHVCIGHNDDLAGFQGKGRSAADQAYREAQQDQYWPGQGGESLDEPEKMHENYIH